MPEFIHKPEYRDVSVDGSQVEVIPGQIHAWFDSGESAIEWFEWLKAQGFPVPHMTLWFGEHENVVTKRDFAVWSPSDNHLMMHKLAWGGTLAE